MIPMTPMALQNLPSDPSKMSVEEIQQLEAQLLFFGAMEGRKVIFPKYDSHMSPEEREKFREHTHKVNELYLKILYQAKVLVKEQIIAVKNYNTQIKEGK